MSFASIYLGYHFLNNKINPFIPVIFKLKELICRLKRIFDRHFLKGNFNIFTPLIGHYEILSNNPPIGI